MIRTRNKNLTAIDVFSGCGGLSCGLKAAGFDVLGAIEVDERAAKTYSVNHSKTTLFQNDVRELTSETLMRKLKLKKGELDLLAGCPPCQGFSRLKTKNRIATHDDERNDLIFDFLRLVRELAPKTVMLENVPGLAEDVRFEKFCKILSKDGYTITFEVLNVGDYGVAQRRKRLILLASKFGQVSLAEKTSIKRTVRDVIGGLPSPGASGDLLHDLKRQHSEKVMSIIRAIPRNGGSRKDLPKKLILGCHKRTNGFKDVYGRMSWDDLSPTITSGCTNPSKGRFIHPEQNRSITLREAALLQGFPTNYKFIPKYGIQATALMVGNALPPPFICMHAMSLAKNLYENARKTVRP